MKTRSVMGVCTAVIMAVAFMVAAPAGARAEVINFKKGAAQLTLSGTLATLLQLNGVTISPLKPTTIKKGVAFFPIAIAGVDRSTEQGEIDLRGGLIFTSGSTTVTVSKLVFDNITTGTTGVVSGLVSVNGTFAGRGDMFDAELTISPPVTLGANGKLKLTEVELTLNASAAATLDTTFGLTLTGGEPVGSVDIVIKTR